MARRAPTPEEYFGPNATVLPLSDGRFFRVIEGTPSGAEEDETKGLRLGFSRDPDFMATPFLTVEEAEKVIATLQVAILKAKGSP